MSDSSSTSPPTIGDDDKIKASSEKLSVLGLAINLVNDITPNGILPLSAALMSSKLPVAVALALMGASAAASWWTINILASLQDVYDKQAPSSNSARIPAQNLHSVLLKPRQAWAVDAMLANLCFWCCVTYVDFAVDLLGPSLVSVTGEWWTRSFTVALLVWAVLYPLCSLRDLAALAPFSTLGVVSVAYVVVFMCVRAVDGSYGPGGEYHDASSSSEAAPERAPLAALGVGGGRALLELAGGGAQEHRSGDLDGMPQLISALSASPFGVLRAPNATKKQPFVSALFSAVQLFALFSVGFLSHYNAGDYYRVLRDATPRKFASASGAVFGGAALVYSAVMLAGALTFGPHAAPTILSSYHPTLDWGAMLGRVGIGASLLTSFPLMFNGLRRSATLLLLGKAPQPSTPSSSGGGGSGGGRFPATLERAASLDLADALEVLSSAVPSLQEGAAPSDGDSSRNRTVVALLAACHTAAYLLPDVGLIVGVIGALFGSATIFALPAALALAHERTLAAATAVSGAAASAPSDSAATTQGAELKGHDARKDAANSFNWRMIYFAAVVAVGGMPYGALREAASM